MHRLMTLEDLYNYYSSQNSSMNFSYEETNEPIVVQIEGNMNFSSNSTSTEGLYPTRVQMNFVGDNLNGSRIEMKAQKSANSSSKYRPLLACIHEVDGEPQFYGHNYHVDDNREIAYDEQPVGVIIEEAHIEHDDEHNKDYAVANGYIWEEYSKAKYILERDGKCDVSVELSIRSLSYNAADKILVLDDFYYSGCTILGMDDNGNKVNPAMPGSNITLQDFSKSCYSVNNSSDKLVQVLEKLNATLSNFEINTLGKEEQSVENQNEVFDEEVTETPEDTVESPVDEVAEDTTEGEVTTEDEFSEESTEDASEPEETPAENVAEFSVTVNGDTKTFSVSLGDKLNAMYSLIQETYGDLDGEWYDINMYDDEKVVEMYGYFTGKNYRQSYKVKKDSYSLVGDRIEIFRKYMSQDEINAFEKMKVDFEALQTNFNETSNKLAQYEAEPAKMEILNSEAYAQIAETEQFVAFKEQDAHFEMSVEEVQAKADAMLLEFAKAGKLEFSAQSEKSVGAMPLPQQNKKTSRYGSIFA